MISGDFQNARTSLNVYFSGVPELSNELVVLVCEVLISLIRNLDDKF